ncbi:MAG: DNA-binding protein [Desulfobulbaceae bacterium]|nr:DNA-binding protein [Desulfobulbaceae bacterium]
MRLPHAVAVSICCAAVFPTVLFAVSSIGGVVSETMNSGGYTYILLTTDKGGGEVWAAIPEQKVEKGQKMTLPVDMEIPNFHSDTLNRDFKNIVFSSGDKAAAHPLGTVAETKAGPTAGLDSFTAAVAKENQNKGQEKAMPEESGGSAGAVAPFADVKVEKATGQDAVTVAEVFDNAKKLNGKTVCLRGRVMKVSLAIMGRNWIHLQDGTGDPLRNTHDLVATSDAAPELGAVIVVSGTLIADKDFGAGYRYAALIEQAKIEK